MLSIFLAAVATTSSFIGDEIRRQNYRKKFFRQLSFQKKLCSIIPDANLLTKGATVLTNTQALQK